MKFFYQKVAAGPGKTIAIPVVNVRLGNQGIHTYCLIDSGATYSFFHASIGEQLGINVTKGEEIEVAGVAKAKFTAFLHRRILLEIGGCQCAVDIAFTPDLGTAYNLLGQHNFFEKFRVCFDLRKNEFEITPKFNGHD